MGDFLFGLLNSFIYLYNMEAKLIKVENTFYLKEGETILGTSSNPNLSASIRYSLSLKNCQAIELGYDLDELSSERLLTRVDKNSGYHKFGVLAYKEGFQKALEVNDDKRFTLEDMMNCWNKALKFQDHEETLGEHIQYLQQTEWDVEVKMICPHPMDTYRCGLQYGCDGDGCNHPNQVPYLDHDGCLILKRK